MTKTSKLATGVAQNGGNQVNYHAGNFQDCADCGSSNVQWASLNHGVIICDECCLAHRSLGRCISVIKSLKKSYWPQSLIDTLYELIRSNSNQIWEAALNHSSESNPIKQFNLSFKGLKKPSAKDSYANKLNYIKMKYENLAFLARTKYSSIDDLNQQLFATVKTNNYEQTLRILSQGADANYRLMDDIGHSCLHAAVQNNQLGQIEILCLYGADLTCLDKNGCTPLDLARMNNSTVIAERLLELQFELTDDFSYFLCGKRPEHAKGRHFLIPDQIESQYDTNRTTKMKLEELPDHLFEEVAKDIYDELDRRQIEIIWKCTVGPNLVNEPIPFLVIKSCFTQTRNQLRQKLARFSSQEFSNLLIEILIEAQRRFNLTQSKKNDLSDEEDEEDPLYDRVPSDEDYASVASESSSTFHHQPSNRTTETSHASKVTTHKSEQKQTPVSTSKSQSKYPSEVRKLVSEKRSHSESPLKVLSPFGCRDQVGCQLISRNNPTCSPPLSNSSSSLSNKSPKHQLPSPSAGKFVTKECKILNTKFDKPPTGSIMSPSKDNSIAASSSLVANAESTLNSIINSLNQIDYSHLSPNGQANKSSRENGGLTELKSENEMMKAMIERLMEENAQLRAEKMLQSTSMISPSRSQIQGSTNITNYIAQNVNNYYKNDDILYATIGPNKKLPSPFTAAPSSSKDLELLSSNRLKDNYFIKMENSSESRMNSHESFSRKLKKSTEMATLTRPNNLAIDEIKKNMMVDVGLKEQSPSPSKPKLKFSGRQEFLPARSASLQSKVPYSSQLASNSVNLQLQHMKLNESKPLSPNSTKQFSHNSLNHHQTAHAQRSQSKSTDKQHQQPHIDLKNFPSKDSVIKKMKKITKAVQELFKATKESDFVSLKGLCERVCQSANEMIALFPEGLNSREIEDNLLILDENCKKLIELISKCHMKLEHFAQMSRETGENNKNGQSDASSPTSSVLLLNSSASDASTVKSSAEDIQLKNVIVSNLVSYSYEIAHTVKRIVCIMGHSENTNL